jgi:hypothetical protein
MCSLQSVTTKTQKLFTVEEANRMLPLIRRIVADILNAGNGMKAMSKETMTGDHAAKLEIRIAELKSYLKELEDLGCSYKDWDFKTGLVDFPAELDGKPVLLCWRSDEDKVSHYHFSDDDYEKRKLIPTVALPR